MRLHSKHATTIEYGPDVVGNDGKRVTLRPGENEVSDEDFSFLKASPSFAKHARNGAFVEIAPPPVVAPEVEQAAMDPRTRNPGESNKAYSARMKALDDAEAETKRAGAAQSEFLAAYDAMSPEEQAAMYATLTPEQKVLIDERE